MPEQNSSVFNVRTEVVGDNNIKALHNGQNNKIIVTYNDHNLNVTDVLPEGLQFINATVKGADIVNQTNSTGASVKYIIEGQKIKWIVTTEHADSQYYSIYYIDNLSDSRWFETVIHFIDAGVSPDSVIKSEKWVDY